MNLLEAIHSIHSGSDSLAGYRIGNGNRQNSAGELAERYMVHNFGNDLAYQGNDSNPPDFVLNSGDVVEVKKSESISSDVPLNSSYPKKYLYRDDTRISSNCRAIHGGNWVKKDIIYAIVKADSNEIEKFWFVYGDCYCADKETYTRIANKLTEGINQIEDIQVEETNELARLNRVDPLGITYLRVRGMWGIQHPNRVFQYLSPTIKTNKINAIMTKSKFDSFPESSRNKINGSNLKIKQVKIKNPDNPAQYIDSVWIHS